MQATLIATPEKLKNLLKRLHKDAYLFGQSLSSEDADIILSKINSRVLKNIIKENTEISNWSDIATILQKLSSLNNAITENRMHITYGIIVGDIKWKSYRQKQSSSNTFEYKNAKYGMTREEFDAYNKARACTKELFKLRHGIKQGESKWEEYRQRQAYTNSRAYLQDSYEIVCKAKSHTYESYLARYGDEEIAKYNLGKYFSKIRPFYSKISQELFIEIEKIIQHKVYYATLNKEFMIYSQEFKRVFFYDFVCPKLKLCIEFHGDHYHGNPKIYTPSQYLAGRGCSKIKAKDAWEADIKKQKALMNERGFQTVTVWESDYRENPTKILQKIQNYLNEHCEFP